MWYASVLNGGVDESATPGRLRNILLAYLNGWRCSHLDEPHTKRETEDLDHCSVLVVHHWAVDGPEGSPMTLKKVLRDGV